ncbi:hypothetical protein BT93_H2204 [Corymbia citriodora subsp. variegata]|nr:hypothetical protein BT93_H2204 [Corymbia citriodora subsp. variegata]
MSSPASIPLFLSAFILATSLSSALAAAKPAPLIFPVEKDASTSEHYTTLQLGTPPTTVNAVLDLGGQFTWIDCDANGGFRSSSYSPVACSSAKCEAIVSALCLPICDSPGPARPGCTNDTCIVYAYNPFQTTISPSSLSEDVLVVHPTDGISSTSTLKLRNFTFSCASTDNTLRFPDSAIGVVALARSSFSLATELSTRFKLPRTFALCLPSSSSTTSGHGDLYIGGGPYLRPPIKKDLAKSLLRTQLLINPVDTSALYKLSQPSDEYFIGVTAINIDSAPITFNSLILAIDKNGVGGTKLATSTQYTVLHSAIFKPLVREFTKKAMDRKIKKAAPVEPLKACFDAKTVKSGLAGPDVPAIVLVLQSGAQWRMEGANSMVRVSKDVMCLGFVDGGSKPRTAIVIGYLQMEDNLVEFDVASSTFGFSNSLLLQNTSCSHL